MRSHTCARACVGRILQGWAGLLTRLLAFLLVMGGAVLELTGRPVSCCTARCTVCRTGHVPEAQGGPPRRRALHDGVIRRRSGAHRQRGQTGEDLGGRGQGGRVRKRCGGVGWATGWAWALSVPARRATCKSHAFAGGLGTTANENAPWWWCLRPRWNVCVSRSGRARRVVWPHELPAPACIHRLDRSFSRSTVTSIQPLTHPPTKLVPNLSCLRSALPYPHTPRPC